MGDVNYKQEISISASRLPDLVGDYVTQVDFEVKRESLEISEFNEVAVVRFSIESGVAESLLSMGTVSQAKAVVIHPENDVLVSFESQGQYSAPLKFLAKKTSIIHMEFTGIKILSTTEKVKGRYFVIGD